MTHRVHPKIFRIRGLFDWSSRWFEKKNFSQFLREDFLIRSFLQQKLKASQVENIEIERFPGKLHIIVTSARPGLIIGRGGTGIEELRKSIEKILAKEEKSSPQAKASGSREIRVEIREVKNPWESASLTAQWIAQQLEKRVPFRRVIKQALSRLMANKGVEGAKVEVAGRLDGAEIARREHLQAGRLPLQTLRASIDYAFHEAQTTYGTIGIKVWIYKGEKFE